MTLPCHRPLDDVLSQVDIEAALTAGLSKAKRRKMQQTLTRKSWYTASSIGATSASTLPAGLATEHPETDDNCCRDPDTADPDDVDEGRPATQASAHAGHFDGTSEGACGDEIPVDSPTGLGAADSGRSDDNPGVEPRRQNPGDSSGTATLPSGGLGHIRRVSPLGDNIRVSEGFKAEVKAGKAGAAADGHADDAQDGSAEHGTTSLDGETPAVCPGAALPASPPASHTSGGDAPLTQTMRSGNEMHEGPDAESTSRAESCTSKSELRHVAHMGAVERVGEDLAESRHTAPAGTGNKFAGAPERADSGDGIAGGHEESDLMTHIDPRDGTAGAPEESIRMDVGARVAPDNEQMSHMAHMDAGGGIAGDLERASQIMQADAGLGIGPANGEPNDVAHMGPRGAIAGAAEESSHMAHGKRVVESAMAAGGEEALERLVARFRAAFVEYLQPAHLPPAWNVNHFARREFGEYSVYVGGGTG